MYITHNNKDYPCKSFKSGKGTKIYSGLPEDFTLPVSGEISLKADDGIVMRTDVAEDYIYHKLENGILTMTNIPEPIPEEPIPVVDEVTTEDMATAILKGVNEV